MLDSTAAANTDAGLFANDGIAVVMGAGGGLGNALVHALCAEAVATHVIALSRDSTPALELTCEDSIAAAAQHVAAFDAPLRLVIDATGFLHGDGFSPEKRLQQLDPAHMAKAFAVNAIGPALLMKHFLPLLPRHGKAVFATLSAKVGSIGDNRLGGWHSYRASKAALNQFVRTAAIELQRRAPQAVCVALHPGTTHTSLSQPFSKTGLEVRTPAQASLCLLDVIRRLEADDSGGFFDYRGNVLPW